MNLCLSTPKRLSFSFQFGQKQYTRALKEEFTDLSWKLPRYDIPYSPKQAE